MSTRIHIVLDDDLAERLRVLAAREDRALSRQVAFMLRQAMREEREARADDLLQTEYTPEVWEAMQNPEDEPPPPDPEPERAPVDSDPTPRPFDPDNRWWESK